MHALVERICSGCQQAIKVGEEVEYDAFFDAMYHPGSCWAANARFLDKLEALEKADPAPVPFELWAPPLP